MASHWRDWANQPDLVTAMWPKLVASHAAPATLLALLGVSPSIRRIVLREAPQAKLTLAAGRAMPSPAPLLELRGSGRTKPTTLELFTGPGAQYHAEEELQVASQVSTNAQYILHLLAGCSTITRLYLQGVLLTARLLKAVQGLPGLNHLDLHQIRVPRVPLNLDPAHLPQQLDTLLISVERELLPYGSPYNDENEQQELARQNELSAILARILSGFLSLNTITDLTINSNESDGLGEKEQLRGALELLVSKGVQTEALRKLSVPFAKLYGEDLPDLAFVAPRLEDLEVWRADFFNEDTAEAEVPWHVLRVHECNLDRLFGLPLGGTADFELHILGHICAQDDDDDAVADEEDVMLSVDHLLLPGEGKRRVRLVGTGAEGTTYLYDNEFESHTLENLPLALSVLQLSKVPVRRIDIVNAGLLNGMRIDEWDRDSLWVDETSLAAGLNPLQSVTDLRLRPRLAGWLDLDLGERFDSLLSTLPLHVERVRLDTFERASEGDQKDTISLFKRMIGRVSMVPERQGNPLRLCVQGAGPGSKVWRKVKSLHALGYMGVVMEEVWE